MTVCEMDVRAGGTFRWRWRSDADGAMGAEPALITVTFEEHGGATVMTTLIEYDSRASHDEAVATGMTDGMEWSYKNLDRTLAERQKS